MEQGLCRHHRRSPGAGPGQPGWGVGAAAAGGGPAVAGTGGARRAMPEGRPARLRALGDALASRRMANTQHGEIGAMAEKRAVTTGVPTGCAGRLRRAAGFGGSSVPRCAAGSHEAGYDGSCSPSSWLCASGSDFSTPTAAPTSEVLGHVHPVGSSPARRPRAAVEADAAPAKAVAAGGGHVDVRTEQDFDRALAEVATRVAETATDGAGASRAPSGMGAATSADAAAAAFVAVARACAALAAAEGAVLGALDAAARGRQLATNPFSTRGVYGMPVEEPAGAPPRAPQRRARVASVTARRKRRRRWAAATGPRWTRPAGRRRRRRSGTRTGRTPRPRRRRSGGPSSRASGSGAWPGASACTCTCCKRAPAAWASACPRRQWTCPTRRATRRWWWTRWGWARRGGWGAPSSTRARATASSRGGRGGSCAAGCARSPTAARRRRGR